MPDGSASCGCLVSSYTTEKVGRKMKLSPIMHTERCKLHGVDND